MIRMHLFGRVRGLSIALIASALIATIACSRQIDIPADESTTQTDQAPFRGGAATPASNTSVLSEGQWLGEGSVPFDDSHSIPVGTLLTVRLNAPLSAGQTEFEASIEDPVVIHGKTMLARETPVSGQVEFATSSNIKPERGYVRLVLTSVRVEGADVPVRSASLFARQHGPTLPSATRIRLAKGHRLTFRLTKSIDPVTQRAQGTR